MLDSLRQLSQTFIANKYEDYQRYFIRNHPLSHRFAIIVGERGVGKTTTIVQHLLSTVNGNKQSDEILYIQADHFQVEKTTLYEIAQSFEQQGGGTIAFDEIHKYENWSMELKSIYDTFPNLRIIASGSSALEIHKGSHDLSRRAVRYRMVGLSFREYIELKYSLSMPEFDFDKLLANHSKYAFQIKELLAKENLKILKLFSEYLQTGYYPYFREFSNLDEFKITLEQNLHTTIEVDLVAVYPQLNGHSIKKIKQLLAYISQSVPFTPNWKNIRQIVEIGDDRTLKNYFKYLEDAYIIHLLKAKTKKLKQLEIPQKVFLGNTNQLYTLASNPNIGNVRETFFISMLSKDHEVYSTKETDFCVDGNFYFEVGGANKDKSQIHNMQNAYLAIDDIEHGSGQRIPLWMFGFLY
jgi:predicted AAA+ superfamily ATPase